MDTRKTITLPLNEDGSIDISGYEIEGKKEKKKRNISEETRQKMRERALSREKVNGKWVKKS